MRSKNKKYANNSKIAEAYREFFALILLHPITCITAYLLFIDTTFGQAIINISSLDILSGVTVTMLVHALLAIRFRDIDKSQNDLTFWEYLCSAVMFVFGCIYAAMFAYVAFVGGSSVFMVLTLVLTAMIAMIGMTLIASQKMMLSFVAPIVASVCIAIAMSQTFEAYVYSAFLSTFFLLMTVLSRRLSMNNSERLATREKAKYLQAKLTLNEAKLKGLVTIDKKTGLYTRKFFDKSYAIEFRRAKRSASPLTVIIAQIDYYIEYEESFGTEQTQKMYISLANVLKHKTKRAGELAAIFDKRSFALLLPNIVAEDAEKFGRVIQKAIIDANIPHKISKIPNLSCVSVSIGIGELTKAGLVSRNGLIKQAEESLKPAHLTGATFDDQPNQMFDFGHSRV